MPNEGPTRCWDHEDCPRDDCEGELEQQDQFNVMCTTCERIWAHIKWGNSHELQTKRGEKVAEKPIAVTDGGTIQDRSKHRNEAREEMFGNAKDRLRDQRKFARMLVTELKGNRNPSDPGNVMPFLAGVQAGLQLGEMEIEDLDKSIMYEPEDNDGE